MGDWAYPVVFGTAMVAMAVSIFVYGAILNWMHNRRHAEPSQSIQRKAA